MVFEGGYVRIPGYQRYSVMISLVLNNLEPEIGVKMDSSKKF